MRQHHRFMGVSGVLRESWEGDGIGCEEDVRDWYNYKYSLQQKGYPSLSRISELKITSYTPCPLSFRFVLDLTFLDTSLNASYYYQQTPLRAP